MPDIRSDLREAHALIAANRPAAARDGFPAEVRLRVTAVVAAALKGGLNLAAIATSLTISAPTLRKWLARAPSTELTFRPVAVDPPPSAPAPTSLTLTSPTGWRVEGLDLDSLAVLLARIA